MKLETVIRNALTVACTAAATAAAGFPAAASATDPSANRIVGLWTTQAEVRPCGTDLPPSTIANTLLIHAGGTIVENPRFPPGGVPIDVGHYERNQALGTWQYNKETGRYWIHLRFDNFVDGAYNGHSVVDRRAKLRGKGMEFAGQVWVTRYDAAGNVMFKLCGRAVSARQ